MAPQEPQIPAISRRSILRSFPVESDPISLGHLAEAVPERHLLRQMGLMVNARAWLVHVFHRPGFAGTLGLDGKSSRCKVGRRDLPAARVASIGGILAQATQGRSGAGGTRIQFEADVAPCRLLLGPLGRRIAAMSAATSPGTGLAFGSAAAGLRRLGHYSFYAMIRPARRAAAGKASIGRSPRRRRNFLLGGATAKSGLGFDERSVATSEIAVPLMRSRTICSRPIRRSPHDGEIITHAPK